LLTTIGLSLIIIAWLEQIYRSLVKKHLSFSPFFLAVYLVGTAILAYDSFNQADVLTGVLEAVTVVLAFIILVTLIYRRRRPGTF
jgi:hypothetical protein